MRLYGSSAIQFLLQLFRLEIFTPFNMPLSPLTRTHTAISCHAPLLRFRMSERLLNDKSSEISQKFELVSSGMECDLLQYGL